MKDDSFKEFVLDQLRELPGVTARSMFGGYGIYQGEVFFAIIHQSRLYFKTNDRTRPAYVKKGMKPFRPNAKQTLAAAQSRNAVDQRERRRRFGEVCGLTAAVSSSNGAPICTTSTSKRQFRNSGVLSMSTSHSVSILVIAPRRST